MISSFEKIKLTELLKDFYTAVGIRISVFDDRFCLIAEYPETPPELCALIRRTPEGLAACRQCDAEAFCRAKKLRKAHSYVCHAGLTEAITPIQLNGGVVGYAIFAHLLPAEQYESTIEEICARCKMYCGSEKTLRDAAAKLEKYSAQKILASMRLLEAIASFLQMSNVVRWKNESLAFHVNDFISQNLAGDLSGESICNRFYISRTKLYRLSTQAFGMGIAQYVAFQRIEKAKELLADEDMSVAKIANLVGVNDYNYFCKLFRKSVGVSPGTYRKNLRRV